MTGSNELRRCLAALLAGGIVWGGVRAPAQAAAASPAEEARTILVSVDADPAARELVSNAVARARAALGRAEAQSSAPQQRALEEESALEWAGVARDLKRARDAEQAALRLEQELSSIQAELVRTRAAVEQALARVGRARQELSERERDAKVLHPAAAAAGAPPTSVPSRSAAPAPDTSNPPKPSGAAPAQPGGQ